MFFDDFLGNLDIDQVGNRLRAILNNSQLIFWDVRKTAIL